MKKILYIHGFKGQRSEKSKLLRDHFFDKEEYSVHRPILDDYKPLESIKKIENIIKNSNEIEGGEFFIIGSSRGGFYALYLSMKYRLPCLLINPAYSISKTSLEIIKEEIASDKYKQMISEIGEIKTEIENMNYDPSIINVYLSDKDEIIDHSEFLNRFKDINSIKWYDDNHRFIKFKDQLPEIQELVIANLP